MSNITPITPIPPLDRTSPTYKDDLEAMFGTRFPNLTLELIAFFSALQAIPAGGGFAVPYRNGAPGGAADPGNGLMRLNDLTIGAITAIYIDNLGSDTRDYSALLNTMGGSTSVVLGELRFVKASDPTAFACFNLLGYASSTGYKTLSVAATSYSASAPFALNDVVYMFFTRTGDRGNVGPAGTLTRRTTTVVSNTAPAPDINTTDMYAMTALAGAAVIGAPTSSGAAPVDGAQLIFRIKDSGTARALSWNAIYRAGADVILPTTTVVSKTMYVGFIYNAADAKWDLMSTLGNI